MFFSKKKPIEDLDILNENRALVESHSQIKSNIQYLENEYETFIIKSLISDFSGYKEAISDNRPEDNRFWVVDDVDKSKCVFIKMYPNKRYERYSCYHAISMKIEHNGELNIDSFKILKLDLSVEDRSINVNQKKFRNIIFKYLISYHINKSEKNLNKSKKSFDSLLSVIGKSVHRDSKIDDILK